MNQLPRPVWARCRLCGQDSDADRHFGRREHPHLPGAAVLDANRAWPAHRRVIQQVQRYENGANRVGASRLTQVANALEVPLLS